MVEREYQFGRLRIRSKAIGLLDDRPAFEVYVNVEKGPSYTSRVASSAPVPASPAHYTVKDMRKVLKMGIQRFVQFRMMNERRMPEEARELQTNASQMYMAALSAGDKTLEEAEKGLEAAMKEELVEYEKQAAAAQEEQQASDSLRFDLGPIKMTVHIAGIVREDMAAFQVTAEVPGLPPHVATVASDDPLFSSQAGWYLDQLQTVLELGPDGFYTRNLEKVRGDAEEGRQFAHSLFQVASALSLAGIEHARGILAQAAAEEVEDADRMTLARLEEELAAVREEISKIEHKRQPRGR